MFLIRCGRLSCQAGLYTYGTDDEEAKGCTNHAIRKVAAQWAGRCGGSVIDAKNNGRWKTTEELSHYISQGAVDRARCMEGGRKDPIWRIWVWKLVTLPGEDGRDQM